MSTFGRERWHALSPYLDQALDIAPEERGVWLESLREQDPALAYDLQTLIREHLELSSEGFLQADQPDVTTRSPVAGQRVGAYALQSPIGQGGMGTVWLARRSDGRFEGRAAVKFLNVALLGGAGEDRFKREGSFLARLAHPHIAHLIDAGTSSSGQPYLILEYVEGRPIDRYCDEHALDLEARIQLFLDVLAAVTHAHANLIVHRDIKPSNVLVTADGQVKLLDFGIAKLLEGESPFAMATALTRDGGRALTPAYAAPEQIAGGSITTATDVYTLGVLLYLLLAGKHPAESSLRSPASLVKAICETEPTRPSDVETLPKKRRRALRGDLDTIILKALKKNPAERYPSVTAFAEDLRRHLGHQTISARPDTLAYRAMRFVRRYRVPVAGTAIVIASLAVGLYVANRERAIAEIRNDRLRLMQAQRMLDKDPTAVLAWLKTYRPSSTTWPKVREIAADALSRGIAAHVFRHDRDVLAVSFAPDGTKLATGSEDSTVKLWDVSSGRQLRKFVLESAVQSVAFSSDGKWLAVGTKDPVVHLFGIDSGEARRLDGHRGPISAVLFNPEENTLASAGSDGTIRLWDIASGSADVLTGHSGEVEAVAFSPDGRWLASGSTDGAMHLWRRPFKIDQSYSGARGKISVVRFSSDSQWIAWAAGDGLIHVLELGTGRRLVLAGHEAEVSGLSFSPDSQSLASGSLDKTIRLWNLSKRSSRIFAGHENRVKDVAFSPDGRLIVSVSSDKAVRVWDPVTGEGRAFIGHRGTTNQIRFQPGGAAFATTSIDASARLWNLSAFEGETWRGYADSLYSLAFAPDGAGLAALGARSVLVWDKKTGQIRAWEDPLELPAAALPVRRLVALCFSSEGQELLIGKANGLIEAWNLGTNEHRQLVGHSRSIRGLLALRGSPQLLSSSDDGTVRVWNTSEKTNQVVQRHQGAALAIAISPDQREIISGGADGLIQKFDRATQTSEALAKMPSAIARLVVSSKGDRLGVAFENRAMVLDRAGKRLALNEHADRVTAIAFSADGEVFASASLDRTIRVWNSASRPSRVLEGHEGPVSGISFSASDPRLASSSWDGTTRLWDLDLGVDRILRGNLSYVTSVEFSPRERLLATTGIDQTLRRWRLSPSLEVPRSPREFEGWLNRLTTMTLPSYETW